MVSLLGLNVILSSALAWPLPDLQLAAEPAPAPTAAEPAPAPPPPRLAPTCASPCAPTPVPPLPRNNSKPLLVAGFASLGAAYAVTSLIGAVYIDKSKGDASDDPLTANDEAEGDRRGAQFGRRLLIPVVGPFVAIDQAPSARAAWGVAMLGTFQAVGAGLAIAGLVQRARYKRAKRLQIAAGPTGNGGGMVTIGGRF